MKQRLLFLVMLVFPLLVGNISAQTYHAIEPNVDGTNYEAYEVNRLLISSNDWIEAVSDNNASANYELPVNALGFQIPSGNKVGLSMRDNRSVTFYVTNCISVAALYKGTSSLGISISVTWNGEEVLEEVSENSSDVKVLDYGANLDPTKEYVVVVKGTGSSNSTFFQIRFETSGGAVLPSSDNSVKNLYINGNVTTQTGTTFLATIPEDYSVSTVPVQFNVHSAATVTVSGDLKENNNGNISTELGAPVTSVTYEIVVTAENGAEATYLLTITRDSEEPQNPDKYHVITPNIDGTDYETYLGVELYANAPEWADVNFRGADGSEYFLPEGIPGLLEPAANSNGRYAATLRDDLNENYSIFYVTNCVSVGVLYDGRNANRGVSISVKENGIEVGNIAQGLSNGIAFLEYSSALESDKFYEVTISGLNNATSNVFLYQVRFEAPAGSGGPSSNTSITNMTVNGNEPVQTGTEFSVSISNNYSELTIPVQFTVHTGASVKVDGNAVENNSGRVSATVDAPETSATYDIIVTAQDEITIANYTLTVIREEVKGAGILIESEIASWDFTVWSVETLEKMGEDANWIEGLGDRAVDRYANNIAITSSELLYSDNTSIIETRGLIFSGTYRASSESSDGDLRIDYGVNPANIALNGSSKSIEIPALLKGDKVIVLAAPNTSTVTEKRGLTASSNTRKISGPEEYIPVGETGEYVFEVITDGDVVLTQNGGLKWYTIQVIGKTAVALTPELLEGKSDIELVGDITSEHIAILKAANLTSINLESASSFAEGFEPANPNCLVFASTSTSILEENPSYNLIIDGEAKEVILTDGHSFNNPKTFTAETLSYTRDFTVAGWASMCLPFDIEVSALEGVEAVQAFTSAEENTIYFTNVAALEANTPYIANVTSVAERTFTSTDVEVPATEMNDVTRGDYTFKGTYSTISGHNHYGLLSNGQGFGVGGPQSTLAAFRAYIDGSSIGGERSLVIGNKDDDDDTTGINDATVNGLIINSMVGGLEIISSESQEISLYGLDGRLVNKTLINEGQTTVTGLQKGIYLLNNQKVVVR